MLAALAARTQIGQKPIWVLGFPVHCSVIIISDQTHWPEIDPWGRRFFDAFFRRLNLKYHFLKKAQCCPRSRQTGFRGQQIKL